MRSRWSITIKTRILVLRLPEAPAGEVGEAVQAMFVRQLYRLAVDNEISRSICVRLKIYQDKWVLAVCSADPQWSEAPQWLQKLPSLGVAPSMDDFWRRMEQNGFAELRDLPELPPSQRGQRRVFHHPSFGPCLGQQLPDLECQHEREKTMWRLQVQWAALQKLRHRQLALEQEMAEMRRSFRQQVEEQVTCEMQKMYEERAKDGRYDICEMMNYTSPSSQATASDMLALVDVPELDPEDGGDYRNSAAHNLAVEQQPPADHVPAPKSAARRGRLRKRRRCARSALVPAAAGAGAAGGEPVL